VITGHEKSALLVSWSRNGQIAAADANGFLYIYPAIGAKPKFSKAYPRSLAWRPDGQRLAVGLNNSIQIWDTNANVTSEHEAPGGLRNLAWSRDGQRIAWAGVNAGVWEPGGDASVLTVHADSTIAGLDSHPDGGRFVSGHARGTVRWWHADGTPGAVSVSGDAPIASVVWSPSGHHVAACGKRQVLLWNDDGQATDPINLTVAVNGLAWSHDSRRLAGICNDSVVRLWNTDGTDGPELSGHTKHVTGVAWSRSGTIVSAGRDNTIRLWHADGTARAVITVSPNNADLNGIAWSPDDRQFAVGVSSGRGAKVRLWDANGEPGPELNSKQPVLCLAWSPDSQLVMGCDAVGGFHIWSRDGESVRDFPALGGVARFVTWSRDNRILTSGDDRTIRCWDGSTLQPLWVAIPLLNGTSATVAADGQVIHATGDPDRLIAYLVEREGGRVEVLNSAGFQRIPKASAPVEAVPVEPE
jgi:WD40 repeat protein